MGSEMCIRDRLVEEQDVGRRDDEGGQRQPGLLSPGEHRGRLVDICLLYTSDAADERSSVDLGGRRIIKKKKHRQQSHLQSISD